jgi:hypothetical protein
MKFSYRFLVLALSAGISAYSNSNLHAQGAPLVPLVMVSFADEQPVHLHSQHGQFAPVPANAGEMADIRLHFPAVYAGTSLVIQAMDGGNLQLPQEPVTIDSQGRASFQFQAGQDPGVYRIVIVASDTPSVLQFSVPSE